MKIDKIVMPYRVVGDYTEGQLYKITEIVDKWLLVGQWKVVNGTITVIYDYPQEIDCAEIIKSVLSVRRINYESDFFVQMSISDILNYDFEVVFKTTGLNEYKASRKAGVLNNLNDLGNGNFEVIFKNHQLPAGELQSKMSVWIINDIMPDGIMKEVTPSIQPIELVNDKSDNAKDVGLDIVLPYAIVDAYDMAVANGYKGTKEDYIKLISNPPKREHKPTGITHHKAICYGSYPNEIYTFGYMRFKLIDGINSFDITGIVGHINKSSGGVICYCGDSVPGRLDIPTLNAWIENNMLYIDNTGLITKKCFVKLTKGYVMFNQKRNLIDINPAQATDKVISSSFDKSKIKMVIGFGGPYNTVYIKDIVNILNNYSYDYEVFKNTRNHIKNTDIYIRRKKWVRGDMVMRKEKVGISIGRGSQIHKEVATGEKRYSFLLRIRESNRRRTRNSEWLYLRCNLIIQGSKVIRYNLVKA